VKYLVKSKAGFKAMTVEDRRDYMMNVSGDIKNKFITNMLSQAPEMLLPYSKWVDWNDKGNIWTLQKLSTIKHLTTNDIWTQHSINYKFQSSPNLGTIKFLFDETDLDIAQKTSIVGSLYKSNGDNEQPTLTYIKYLIQEDKLDWNYLNETTTNSYGSVLQSVFANHEAYPSFCKFLLNHPKFVASGSVERAIWSRPDMILLLLNKDNYQLKSSPKSFLDNGMIHEMFEYGWTVKQKEEYIELVNTIPELAKWIQENNYMELMSNDVKEMFLF